MPVDPNMLALFLGAAGQGISSGNVAQGLAPAVMGMAGKKMQDAETAKKLKGLKDILMADDGDDGTMKMFEKFLKGGGRLTVDNENFNIKAPTSLLGKGKSSKVGGLPDMTGVLTGMDSNTTPAPSVPSMSDDDDLAGMLSFFSEGSKVDFLENIDLTGLSPEDLSNALQMKYTIEDRPLNRFAKIMEIKQNVAALENQRNDNLRAWYTTLSKDERTEEKKKFDDFNQNLIDNGKKPITMERWLMTVNNDSWNDFMLSKEDPGYLAHMEKMKKAGATTVNMSPQEKAYETTLGGNKADIRSPERISQIEKSVVESLNSARGKEAIKLRLNKKEFDKEVKNGTRKRYLNELRGAFEDDNINYIVEPNGEWSFYKRGEYDSKAKKYKAELVGRY